MHKAHEKSVHNASSHHEKHVVYKKKRRFPLKRIVGALALLGFFIFAYFFVIKDIPTTAKLGGQDFPQSTKIYDRNGKLLYTIYANKNQTFTPVDEIPENLRNATIAIEDKDFYKHGGIDPRGITRAFYYTLFKGEVQGGSTITQQLVKNSVLTSERTLTRKARELVLAFVVEALYSKDRILEMYLNYIPYGGTAWGVEAASQVYFGKKVQDLTLAESAFLAGMPESPSIYSPFGSKPELGKRRQRTVLTAMTRDGYITEQEADEAYNQKLEFSRIADKIYAPHFVFYIKELLVEKYGQRTVEQGGLEVKTTLDLTMQEFAQMAVASEVASLAKSKVSNGAALVTNPATGEILAMVGSHDYFDIANDGNENVTIRERQPGSSIKPINYAVGLAKGYTAATPFVDNRICFKNTGGADYCPRNYDGKFHGVVQMRLALGSSLNIPAVKMLKLNGIEDMIASASAMGIDTFDEPDRYGLSLTLGGGEVKMTDMAEAFGVFANGGYRIDLQPILKVTKDNGKVLEEYKVPKSPIFGKKALPEGVAYIMSHMLLDNNARSLAFGTNSPLRIGNNLPVSVKTGTTNDFRDNWTVGYTPNYVVAVWVGNNNNTPMQGVVSGVTGAAPIWHDIMEYAVKKTPPKWPTKPDNVIGVNVCANSGLLPKPDGDPNRCPTRFEYFIKGTEPKTMEPGRTKVFIDKATGDLAKAGQTDNIEEKEEIVVTDPTGDRYCITCPHPEPTKP
jgi:1A family penicillin-binding protein